MSDLHVIRAAKIWTASVGASQDGQNGFSRYWAKVSAVMAFPVGTRIKRATQRYKNAGRGPNATSIYA